MLYTKIDKLIDSAAEITVFSDSTLYLLGPKIKKYVYRLERSRPYLWNKSGMKSYRISFDSDLFFWEILTDSREKAVQQEWRKEKDDAETERWKSVTDKEFLHQYSRGFHENQSLDEYIDDIHRYLMLSSWHYSK